MAHVARHRNSPHDSERKGEMAGQRRRTRASPLHHRLVRHCGVDDFSLHSILHGPLCCLFELRNGTAVFASFRSRTALQLEILALRHQLGVLQRSVKRPKLIPADRWLWACLCAVWSDWQSSVFIVRAGTVIGWHRKGFRLFWAWKVRHGKPGRPAVPKEVRALIRTMSRENSLWGAPRIHGELLKLGIEIGETSVGKYMVRGRKPPSQTWRTFLENHLKTMVSVDFFTVPTIRFQVLYVFLVLAHDRRRILHFGVTAHPTAEWTAQQLREAFPWET